jgi:DNA-binding PadR family transcriptional regulator
VFSVRPPREFLPNTSYAILGLLSFDRELSGYELKQLADGSLRFFYWSPAMSQVYAQLDRLEELGLVTSRDVQGEGTRLTRVFRITATGQRELRRWLEVSPVEPPVLKHTVALRLFFGHLADPERLRAVLDEHSRRCRETLAELDVVKRDLADDPTWRYARAVADWGEQYFAAEVDATQRARRQLSRSRR